MSFRRFLDTKKPDSAVLLNRAFVVVFFVQTFFLYDTNDPWCARGDLNPHDLAITGT